MLQEKARLRGSGQFSDDLMVVVFDETSCHDDAVGGAMNEDWSEESQSCHGISPPIAAAAVSAAA